MFFPLLSLLGLVACSSKMDMIDTYLNGLIPRMEFTLNYALDQALTVVPLSQGSELAVNEFKKNAIRQAKALYIPYARSLLMESLNNKAHHALLKRSGEQNDSPDVEDVKSQDAQSKTDAEEVKAESQQQDKTNIVEDATVEESGNIDKTNSGDAPAGDAPVGDAPVGDAPGVSSAAPYKPWGLSISTFVRNKYDYVAMKLADAFSYVTKRLKMDEQVAQLSSDEDKSYVQKFKQIFASISYKHVGIALGSISLLYLIYRYFFAKETVEEHEYFE